MLNKAVATSGAYGFRFDAQGTYNHLFDPMTGGCAPPSKTIAVIADTATTADALSTAFTLMQEKAIGAALALTTRTQAYSVAAGSDARDLALPAAREKFAGLLSRQE